MKLGFIIRLILNLVWYSIFNWDNFRMLANLHCFDVHLCVWFMVILNMVHMGVLLITIGIVYVKHTHCWHFNTQVRMDFWSRLVRSLKNMEFNIWKFVCFFFGKINWYILHHKIGACQSLYNISKYLSKTS